MKNFIEITDLKKVFVSGDEHIHAFGPASISINSGEFVSVLGPSGCGKSTLMLMIAGLLDSTSGKVEFEGKLVKEPKTDIGIMFQENTLVPWRTIKANIELQLELRGIKVKDFQNKTSCNSGRKARIFFFFEVSKLKRICFQSIILIDCIGYSISQN